MGIVNVTPDSFSDGGQCEAAGAAIAHGLQLLADGADILDVGGESTRPGFTPVDTEEELRRVIPVIEGLVAQGAVVSIDTRHAEVAKAAIAAGASIINDVTGFSDPAMVEVARSCDAGLVVVRNSVTTTEWSGTKTPSMASRYFSTSDAGYTRAAEFDSVFMPLHSAGIAKERITFDPGFGFVDTYEEDLMLWSRLEEFTAGLYPVLVGVSRKRLVGRVSGIEVPADRDEASAQLAVAAILHGAKIIRTHNVALTKKYIDEMDQAPIVTAYVALGSNLGDKEAYLNDAIRRINALPETEVVAQSSFIETEAQYVTDQPDFLNAVIRIETKLDLIAFFAELQVIEVAMGRVKEYDKGPRIIDLDLLLYEDVAYQTKELTVPHPLMHERDFVLQPLHEVFM